MIETLMILVAHVADDNPSPTTANISEHLMVLI